MNGDLRAALSSQHQPAEGVDADGDDWYGCICGERECLVLALIPEGEGEWVTEETLAMAIIAPRTQADFDDTPKSYHDVARHEARVILRHLREGTK